MGLESVDPEVRAEGFRRAFQSRLGFPRRLGLFFALLLLVCGAALLGRLGTDLARVGGGLFFAVGLVTLVVGRRVARRRRKNPELSLFRSLKGVDDKEAGRAVRAYSLARRLRSEGQESGESPELAELHVSRVLDGFSLEAVASSAQTLRRRGLLFVLGLGLGCFYLLLYRPLNVVEGVDVLFARNGVGPFPLSYVSEMSVTAELPAYLDGTGKKHFVSSRLATVPQGAEVEVRVTPRVGGRKLLLTDGVSEVPFVSDGQGGLVARWIAEDPSRLRVAARFGEVLLLDMNETRLSPLDDRGPAVLLEGAPQTLNLEDLENLPLRYSAVDDHGLTQVDLVLRSGQRSTRKELVHLDGQKRMHQGAYTLDREHELLRKSFLPVRVSIEARDGNTATGPSWGKSQEYTLLPPPLGEEVAKRHQKLRAIRSALGTYLAADIQASSLSVFEARQKREEAHQKLSQRVEELAKELAELREMPQRSVAFLRAQIESLSRKGAERSTAEAVLLATDVLIADIAMREARDLSQALGSAVEEIAVQSRELRFNREGVRLDGLFDLVRGAELGAQQLREVGILGLDLGSVARGDLGRVRRNLESHSYDRAEVAAKHLAERLKRATPSFGSKGGAGVESGTPNGGSGSDSGEGQGGPPSDAPSEFQELGEQIDQLAQENAGELARLEELLREAAQAAKADFEPTDELSDATEELRRALTQLPSSSQGGPGGVQSEAASGRSQAEAMADAIEAGDLVEGIERGADARDSLRRAEELLNQRQGWLDPYALEQASKALDRALEAARKQAEQLLKKGDGKPSDALTERAARQRELARRAAELSQRGRDPNAPLPSESVQALERASRLLRQAADEMSQGRTRSGVRYSAEAQDQLEQALPGSEQPPGDSELGDTEGPLDPDFSQKAVPDEDRDRARDFRERVERGLGRESGRLAPAVRRYAEEIK